MYSVKIIVTDEDSGKVIDSTSKEFEDLDKAVDTFEDSSADMLCME